MTYEKDLKFDEGKVLAGVLADFGKALMAVAEVGTFGAKKYARNSWRTVPKGLERYEDALWRHLLAYKYETYDPESQLLHFSHFCWNALAILELMLSENRKESPWGNQAN